MRHPRPPSEDFLQRQLDAGNWVQKLLDMVNPKPNQRPQIQLLEQGDLFRQNNSPVRVLRKSTNVSYLAAESTNERTARPVCNCVPVSVERLDKDKDADENAGRRSS